LQFVATEIVEHFHLTYFYGIQQIAMKDRLLIDTINPIFIAVTAMAIHHGLSAWTTSELRVPQENIP